MDVLKALDEINNGNLIDLNELETGRGFVTKLLEDRVFLSSLCNVWGHPLRKGGTISGDFLPLTVSILNRDESPAKQVYLGNMVWIVVYYGISPELENFVTVVLWPSKSASSQSAYRRIIDILQSNDRVISLEGKYALNPPNELHPAWAHRIETAKQQSSFYDWKFYPFLKETGDCLLEHGSPANYRKVFLRDDRNELREEYINAKVIVGVILDKRAGEILVKTPHINTKPRPYWFEVNRPSIHRQLQVGRSYYLFVLQKPLVEKTEVIDLQDAGIHDFVAQVMAHKLYRLYLRQAGLFVASREEYITQFDNALEIALATFGRSTNFDTRLLSPDMLYQYLQPFFRAIKGNLYYVPKIISHLHEDELFAYDKMLQTLGKYGLGYGSENFLPKRVLSKIWTGYNTIHFLKCLKQYLINREKLCRV